jgi:hypothetical protein
MSLAHEQMAVTIEGTQYALPDTAAGEIRAASFQGIAVADGTLTLYFRDLGGPNPYVTLAGLEIVADATPALPPLLVSIMVEAMAEDGTTTATVSRSDTAGSLVVSLSSDKPDEATVPAEVVILEGQTTSAPFPITGQPDNVYDADETVTITAAAAGFSAGSDTVVVTNIDPSPGFEVHFDFGPAGSQVALGYTLVTHTNAMWQAGADGLGSIVRSSGNALQQDIVYMKSATLAVPVPDGRYDLTLHVGDMSLAHEQMAVTIEGTQYALPDTAAGEIRAASFQGIAVADGTLTLYFRDLGGPNLYVTLVGMDLVQKPSALAPSAALRRLSNLLIEEGTMTVEPHESAILTLVEFLGRRPPTGRHDTEH